MQIDIREDPTNETYIVKAIVNKSEVFNQKLKWEKLIMEAILYWERTGKTDKYYALFPKYKL
jgi:hypothetical protein